MGNIETTTKFSRLKSISGMKIIILLLYSNLSVFGVSFQLKRKTIILYCEENIH